MFQIWMLPLAWGLDYLRTLSPIRYANWKFAKQISLAQPSLPLTDNASCSALYPR
jgi:hypothetical protein